jgi:hypothetical protein
VQLVQHRRDDQAALVHALAHRAVLVVHELVLVDRRDRVAPAREVLTQVGVAAIVALERGAVRCRAAVAARVVAVHEHDDRRPRRPVARVVDRPAELDGHRGCRPGEPTAGGVRLLQVDGADLQRIERHRCIRPTGHRVGRRGQRSRRHEHRGQERERYGLQDRGHQFSVRSIHGCIRARTASSRARRSGEIVRPRLGAGVWTAGRKVPGQRPTDFT